MAAASRVRRRWRGEYESKLADRLPLGRDVLLKIAERHYGRRQKNHEVIVGMVEMAWKLVSEISLRKTQK